METYKAVAVSIACRHSGIVFDDISRGVVFFGNCGVDDDPAVF